MGEVSVILNVYKRPYSLEKQIEAIKKQTVKVDSLDIHIWFNNPEDAKVIQKLPIDKKVTVIAITIPKIPKKLPCLDVSGEDNPLNAKINNTPEIK